MPPDFESSGHPEIAFLDVILRSPASGGTTKNLEILRGACPESADWGEGLRMTLSSLRMDTSLLHLTLMLHTYTGKNRCARAIERHLRLYSPRTGLHVR